MTQSVYIPLSVTLWMNLFLLRYFALQSDMQRMGPGSWPAPLKLRQMLQSWPLRVLWQQSSNSWVFVCFFYMISFSSFTSFQCFLAFCYSITHLLKVCIFTRLWRIALEKQCFFFTLCSHQLMFAFLFLHHEVLYTLPALLSITFLI